MAALLVAMGVMAVLMTAAMPVWKQISQREKEAELIFRGQQYARAIGLFQRKAGPGVLPPNIDVLVEQKYLRAKYKDPITGQDFDLLNPTQETPSGGPGGTTTPTSAGRGTSTSSSGRGTPPSSSGIGSAFTSQSAAGGRGAAQGGVIGVASKSKAKSIRLYNGRNHYNEWQFIYVQQVQAPGAPAPGSQPQRGQQPGGLPGMGGRGGRQGPIQGPQGPNPVGAGRDGRGAAPRQPLPSGGVPGGVTPGPGN